MNDALTVNMNAGGIIGGSVAAQSTMKLNLNAGTLMHTNGVISAGTFDSPVWTIATNAVHDLRFDGNAFLGDSSDRLTNSAGGTLRKSVGTGTSLVDWFFSNEGAVEVQTGTLELNDSGSLAGSVSLASDAVLLLDAGTFAFLNGGTAGGDGTLKVDTTADVASGATYTANTDLQLDPAGTLGGSGTLELNDVLLIGGGAMNDSATINANAGGQMSASVGMQSTVKLNLVGGTFVHTNGSFNGGTFNDPTVAIKPGAIYDLRFDGTAFSGDTSDTVTNSPGATFRKSSGTGNGTVDWEFNSGGRVDIQTGTIRFISGGRFAGTNTVATNARWFLDGGNFSLANGGRVSGDGRWEIDTTADTAGGAIFNSDSQTDLTSAGILGGSGILNLNGPFNIRGGTMNDSVTVNVNDSGTVTGSLGMASTATMNVRGTMTHTAGTVSGGTFNDPNVRVLTNGVYDIQADGTVYNGDGSDGFVVNAGGTLRKSVGTGNATVDWAVTQNGHADVQTGILDFNVGGTWGGTSQIASGAELLFDNGTFTLNNGGQIGGDGTWSVAAPAVTVAAGAFDADNSTVRLANGGIFSGRGFLNVSGALHVLQGATVNDSVTLNATGGGTVTGSSSFAANATVNFGGNFTHTGTINGGTFNDPVVNLLSNSIYEVDLHGALFDGDSSDRLNILPGSTLRKTATTNFAFVDWTTTHGGNIEVLGGTLHFVREITQTNGSIRVAGGEFSVNNHLTLQAGLLTGSGLVDVLSASAVRNNGAIVAPGSSPGTLVIDGNYEQAAGGTLQIEIGGTNQGSEHDLLLVTNGSATLNGSLQITVISNFLPQAGQSFTFMVAEGGITGTFTNTPGNKYTIAGVGTFDVTYGTNEVRLGNFNTILTGPAITGQPRSQVARVGDSVNLTVSATGTPPLFYQWRVSGSIIADATNSTYAIPAAGTNHTGSYGVIVSNAVASVTSSNATVLVLPRSAPAPAASGLLSIGSSASEEVEAMAVDANGNVYLAGSFSNSMTVGTNLLSAQGEDMFLIRVNASGDVFWAISAGGAGTDAASAIAVDAMGHVYVAGDTDSRPADFGTNSVTPTGGTDGFIAKFSPLGSNLWTRTIGSDSNDEAIGVAVMSDGVAVVGQVRNSEASINIGSLGVSGRGSDDGFVAKFDENGNTQWARVVGGTGSDVVNAVAVDGDSIYFGGEFRSTAATFNQGASFVTNQGGADLFVARFDRNGNLNWSSTVGTSGEETVNALSVRGDTVAAVGFFTASVIAFGSDVLNNTGGEEAFLWGIRTNGQTRGANRFGGTGHDRALDIEIDPAGSLLIGGMFSSTSATFGTNTLGTPGTSGFVTKVSTNQGIASWAVQIADQNESIQAIGVGPNREIYAAGNFLSPLLQLGSGTITNQGGSDTFLARLTNDVIYVRRQPTNLVINAGTDATFSTEVVGEMPIRYQWFKGGSVVTNATNATLVITSTEAGDAGGYSLMASNLHGVAASDTAFLSVNIPPSITSHPGDQSVILGAATGFSVSATGTLPLFYQWRKDGTAIAGATNASFNISSLTAADTGTYSAVVTNVAGSVVSSNANLTVLLPPTVTAQPQNRAVAVGGSTLLSVAATGAQPLFYQWRKNTSPLSAETNASLLISNATLGDSGSYDVVVSNQVATVISSNAVVTVANVPVIDGHPQSRSAREGATVVIGVAATGATACQWRKDGAAINGATNALLTLTKIAANAAGIYSVRVSNSFTNIVSSNATLTVSGSSVVAELGRWPEHVRGEAFDVVYTSGYIYVASGPAGLKICSLTNGNTLNTIAQVDTDGSANALCVLSNRVYLADGEKGVKIIDVSDAFHPAIIGSFNTTTFAKDVFAIGNRLFVADLESGVHIGDISNPASPTRLGTFDSPGRAEGVFASGGLLYVADMAAGLHIVSVTNPAAPALVGTYDTIGFSRSVQVVGTNAYVADWSGGLRIVDVSNPAAPASIGVLTNAALAYDVKVSGSRAYVAGYNSGLRAVNISNPAAPGLLGTLNTAGLALGVDVQGSMAFVADWTGGLLVVNVANPAPQLLASKSAPGSAWDLRVIGNHAFIADFDAGLQIVNISDPENPSKIAQVDTPGSAVGIHVADNHAFVADYDRGLVTIDVTNPSAPNQRGTIDTAGYARAVDVSGEYAYIADDIAGLQVVSISNPANLTRIGGVDTLGTAYAVKIHNHHAFVADFERGLQIFSVTNPAAPVRVGGIDTDGEAWDLLINGNRLFLADGRAGLKVFNIADPTSPTLGGSVNTAGDAVGLSLSGNLLAVADWAGGTRFFNISNPTSPSALVSLDNDALASGVQVVGDHAFVAARNHGLAVLNLPGGGGTVPRITQQPQNSTVTTGSPASFFALVNGSRTLTCQWQKNGVDIAGATNRGYLIASPTTSDSGQYRVVVSNAFGQVVSAKATLTVNNLQEGGSVGGSSDTDQVAFRLRNSRLVGDVMELEFVPVDRQPTTLTGWRVQASTDLENWITLPAVPSADNGAFRVNDPAATCKLCRFYRVVREQSNQ